MGNRSIAVTIFSWIFLNGFMRAITGGMSVNNLVGSKEVWIRSLIKSTAFYIHHCFTAPSAH